MLLDFFLEFFLENYFKLSDIPDEKRSSRHRKERRPSNDRNRTIQSDSYYSEYSDSQDNSFRTISDENSYNSYGYDQNYDKNYNKDDPYNPKVPFLGANSRKSIYDGYNNNYSDDSYNQNNYRH